MGVPTQLIVTLVFVRQELAFVRKSGDGPGAPGIRRVCTFHWQRGHTVNSIIWWVGAIVIILAIVGFLGFR